MHFPIFRRKIVTKWLFIVTLCLFLYQNSKAMKKIDHLQTCPDSPNCVSSFADPKDQEHYISSSQIDSSFSIPEIINALEKIGGNKIVEQSPNYIKAVFTSRFFKFKDDVEFLIQKDLGLLHYRSASRTGYSDLGVNRKRILKIKQILNL